MTDIEIPHEKDRHFKYRLFEILPGSLSWLLLFMPLILSLISVTAAAFFILAYIIIYFTRSVAVDIRALIGYREMKKYMKVDWWSLLPEIDNLELSDAEVERPKWHYENILRLSQNGQIVKPSEVMHAIIIATYNESREVVEPTFKAIIESDYD